MKSFRVFAHIIFHLIISFFSNPEAITTVCHEQGLSVTQCQLFSRGFQLIDQFMTTIEKPVVANLAKIQKPEENENDIVLRPSISAKNKSKNSNRLTDLLNPLNDSFDSLPEPIKPINDLRQTTKAIIPLRPPLNGVIEPNQIGSRTWSTRSNKRNSTPLSTPPKSIIKTTKEQIFNTNSSERTTNKKSKNLNKTNSTVLIKKRPTTGQPPRATLPTQQQNLLSKKLINERVVGKQTVVPQQNKTVQSQPVVAQHVSSEPEVTQNVKSHQPHVVATIPLNPKAEQYFKPVQAQSASAQHIETVQPQPKVSQNVQSQSKAAKKVHPVIAQHLETVQPQKSPIYSTLSTTQQVDPTITRIKKYNNGQFDALSVAQLDAILVKEISKIPEAEEDDDAENSLRKILKEQIGFNQDEEIFLIRQKRDTNDYYDELKEDINEISMEKNSKTNSKKPPRNNCMQYLG